MSKSNYKEIFILKTLLEGAEIPFEWCEVFEDVPDLAGYQIRYPAGGAAEICSVIEHGGSFGHRADKLEIMGLLTPGEEMHACVAGWLSAINVYARIRDHYRENTAKQSEPTEPLCDEKEGLIGPDTKTE